MRTSWKSVAKTYQRQRRLHINFPLHRTFPIHEICEKFRATEWKVYLLLCCLNYSIHIGWHVHDAHTIKSMEDEQRRQRMRKSCGFSCCNGVAWKMAGKLFAHFVHKHNMFLKFSKECFDLALPLRVSIFPSAAFANKLAERRSILCSICLCAVWTLSLAIFIVEFSSVLFSFPCLFFMKVVKLLIFWRQPIRIFAR